MDSPKRGHEQWTGESFWSGAKSFKASHSRDYRSIGKDAQGQRALFQRLLLPSFSHSCPFSWIVCRHKRCALKSKAKSCTKTTKRCSSVIWLHTHKHVQSGWGVRLWNRFCKMFSESSTDRWAVLQLQCCLSKQRILEKYFSKPLSQPDAYCWHGPGIFGLFGLSGFGVFLSGFRFGLSGLIY